MIPQTLINFMVYDDKGSVTGIADVDMPKLEAMVATIKGNGVSGEVDIPILGHYKNMELTLNFRTVTDRSLAFSYNKSHYADCRGSIQQQDNVTGEVSTVQIRVVVKGMPTTYELGKLSMGEANENKLTLSLNYIKVLLNGKQWIELDKYSNKCIIDGVDLLESVRADLGMTK